MLRRIRRVLSRASREDGLTLVELLVASAMSIVLLGAIGSMVISAMRTQPSISKRSQNISSGRYVLDRMTHEIRNGIRVDRATASEVSFLTYVRRTACGASTQPAATAPAMKCEVTYKCTTTACSRIEAAEGKFTGTAKNIFTGLSSSNVFCFVPSGETDPLTCGTTTVPAKTTYVGVKLRFPNPTGGGALTVSDGASLRNAILLR
jgi:hypothetical protein